MQASLWFGLDKFMKIKLKLKPTEQITDIGYCLKRKAVLVLTVYKTEEFTHEYTHLVNEKGQFARLDSEYFKIHHGVDLLKLFTVAKLTTNQIPGGVLLELNLFRIPTKVTKHLQKFKYLYFGLSFLLGWGIGELLQLAWR